MTWWEYIVAAVQAWNVRRWAAQYRKAKEAAGVMAPYREADFAAFKRWHL